MNGWDFLNMTEPFGFFDSIFGFCTMSSSCRSCLWVRETKWPAVHVRLCSQSSTFNLCCFCLYSIFAKMRCFVFNESIQHLNHGLELPPIWLVWLVGGASIASPLWQTYQLHDLTWHGTSHYIESQCDVVMPGLRPQPDESGDRVWRQIVGLRRKLVAIADVQCGKVHPIRVVWAVTDVVWRHPLHIHIRRSSLCGDALYSLCCT